MSGGQALELMWVNNLPCELYYLKFLEFFQLGEHSVNHGKLCTGEDVFQACGH
jgi:hypothetical protein